MADKKEKAEKKTGKRFQKSSKSKIVLEHDHNDHHRMDTNGFSNHAELHEQAVRRFERAALAFAEHILLGTHEICDDDCPAFFGFLSAYHLYISSE